MRRLPDPDSSEMGMWVDGWLQTLRREGASSRELRRSVRALAEALARNDWNKPIVQCFVSFVEQSPCESSP